MSFSLPPDRLATKSYEDLRKLEDIAVDLIAEYAAQFWANRRRRWEHAHIEVTTLDEDDPNNIREYRLSVDAANEQLIDDVRSLASDLREGPVHHLKLGVVMADNHAYKPLLYATGKGEVTVQPVPLGRQRAEGRRRIGRAGSGRQPLPGKTGAVPDPQPDTRPGRIVLR